MKTGSKTGHAVWILFMLVFMVSCASSAQEKPVSARPGKLVYHALRPEIDTSNFQHLYDLEHTINFNNKYYLGVFVKSTHSCLYCLVNTETHVLTPLPYWAYDVRFS